MSTLTLDRNGAGGTGPPPGWAAPDRSLLASISSGQPWSAVVALSVMTLVAAAGMTRLFVGLTYLGPVLVSGASAHALSVAWRRLRVRGPLALLLSVVSAALISVWLILPGSTWYGVPAGRTLTALQGAIAHGVTAFQKLAAPAPALPGFLLVATWAVAAAAILGDALLCRADAPLEACIPAFTLFVFTAALGTPGARALTTALYLAAVAGFALIEQVHRRTSLAPFLPGAPGRAGGSVDERAAADPPPRSRARRRLLGAGAALGALAVVVGSLVGPHLPGASSPGLVALHNHRAATAPRVAESPLVSVKAELLSPPSVQVFSVAASAPSYWRLTALDHFNGTVWTSTEAYQGATGQLSGPGASGAGASGPRASEEVTQTYRITGLASAWLPAAYRPVHLSGIHGAGYDRSSASLLAPSTTSPGMTYTVESVVPDFTAAELRQARVDPGDRSLAPDLQLPANIPEKVERLARTEVKGQTTPYGKALALQKFFRENFTYSLAPPPDDSVSALVDFLFKTKKGYCEQFAGAYAVMAREVGLPTRVAVGFTQGQLGPDGRYQVLALDAHAWPEVWLGRYGWVPFEPTPGRGEPGAKEYTGVAPEQAEPPGVTEPASPPPTTAPPTTVSPVPVSPAARSAAAPSARAARHGTSLVAGGASSSAHGAGAPRRDRVPALAGGLAGLAAVILVGVLLLLPSLRRARRRAVARGAERVVLAFTEASEALTRRGVARRPAETLGQYARRAAPHCPPEAQGPLAELALAAEAAIYGPRLPSADEVASAMLASRSVRRALRQRRGDPPAHRRRRHDTPGLTDPS
jgi:transglutaminase-like putative cysteine protease